MSFKWDKYHELYNTVAACLVGEPKFYGEPNDDIKRIDSLVNDLSETDPLFILQLAVYARNNLNLRSISTKLLVDASLNTNNKKYVRRFAPRIIRRADELTEAIAYLQSKIGDLGDKRNRGSVPACLKRGLADSFSNFDAYQLAKYNHVNGAVKLRDVWRLVWPKPANEERKALYNKLLDNRLDPPDTWESNITAKGSTKENWEQIIPKMPIMALVRNLRNFLDKDISNLDAVVSKLTTKEIILKSKMFPFRFLAAYREIEHHQNYKSKILLSALEQAMDISVDNLPKLQGLSALFADNSGSMESTISGKSKMRANDIATTICAIADKMGNAVVGAFGETFQVINLNPRNGVLTNASLIRGLQVGYSTNAYLAVQHLLDNNIKVDRIMVFTDGICYNTNGRYGGEVAPILGEYRSRVNHNVYYYEVNLMGYGMMTNPQNDSRTCLLSGWSEKILDFVKVREEAGTDAIDKIKQIE
jgi:hypothetical protein